MTNKTENAIICVKGKNIYTEECQENCQYSALEIDGLCGSECHICHGDNVQFADGLRCADCGRTYQQQIII